MKFLQILLGVAITGGLIYEIVQFVRLLKKKHDEKKKLEDEVTPFIDDNNIDITEDENSDNK